jgi:hypothetical protein
MLTKDTSRIHVSQGRHEIFLVFAEYDDDYLAYLNNSSADNKLTFLTMHQIGPSDTQSASDMKALGPILLAITLNADAEIQAVRP